MADMKDSFYKQLEHALDQFLKYHTTIWLGNINANLGGEDTFKPKPGNESLGEISNNIMGIKS
jgi:hypothetical protein